MILSYLSNPVSLLSLRPAPQFLSPFMQDSKSLLCLPSCAPFTSLIPFADPPFCSYLADIAGTKNWCAHTERYKVRRAVSQSRPVGRTSFGSWKEKPAKNPKCPHLSHQHPLSQRLTVDLRIVSSPLVPSLIAFFGSGPCFLRDACQWDTTVCQPELLSLRRNGLQCMKNKCVTTDWPLALNKETRPNKICFAWIKNYVLWQSIIHFGYPIENTEKYYCRAFIWIEISRHLR